MLRRRPVKVKERVSVMVKRPRLHIDQCVRSTAGLFSWPKAFDFPSLAVARVAQAIVQSAAASLPEFDLLRDHAVSAPEVGYRNVAAGELNEQLGGAHLQLAARRQHAALLRHPCPDLRRDRPRMEIRLARFAADKF